MSHSGYIRKKQAHIGSRQKKADMRGLIYMLHNQSEIMFIPDLIFKTPTQRTFISMSSSESTYPYGSVIAEPFVHWDDFRFIRSSGGRTELKIDLTALTLLYTSLTLHGKCRVKVPEAKLKEFNGYSDSFMKHLVISCNAQEIPYPSDLSIVKEGTSPNGRVTYYSFRTQEAGFDLLRNPYTTNINNVPRGTEISGAIFFHIIATFSGESDPNYM